MRYARAGIPGALLLVAAAAITAAGCGAYPVQSTTPSPVVVSPRWADTGSWSPVPPRTSTPTQRAAPRVAARRPRVPVSVVTFSENLGVNSHGKRSPAPATIVGTAKASQIAALINRQGLFPQNATYNCPNDDLQSLTLTFRDRVGGPVVEAAALSTSGCQLIAIIIDGKSEPLRGPSIGRRVAAQAIKIAGLHWKLPSLG